MYEKFTQERIAQLRLKRDVSARDMSLSLGQNVSYINKIENGKSLPSLQGLFYICDYLGVTPQEFFDLSSRDPGRIGQIVENLKKLDDQTLASVAQIVQKLADAPHAR